MKAMIVCLLVDNVAMQDKMVRQRLKVVKTHAGRVLDEHLRQVGQLRVAQAEAERELEETRERLPNGNETKPSKAQ